MLQAVIRLAPSLVFLVVAMRLRVILRAFRDAGTLSPGSAVPLRTLPVVTRGLPMKILTRHGVVVKTEDGGHDLDLAAAERWRRRRLIVLPIVLTVLASGLVVILWLGAGRSS